MINLNLYKKATVFHSEEFNKIIEETLGKKVNFIEDKDYFYIIHPNKKLKLNINYCPDPRLECVYGGILGNKNIIKSLKGFWHITTIPGENIDKYLKKGFQAKERFTSILHLDKTEEELWKNLNKKTRNLVRKGQKNNLRIVNSKNIDKYYEILKETYDKAKLKILPKEFYQKILNKLGKLFLVEYNEKIVAGAIILKFRDTIYYWNGCSNKNYNYLAPNNLIQWEIIKWAKENNFKKYDLLGLDIPSIAEFKEGFGGERVKFYTLFSKKLYFFKKIKDLGGILR